MTSKLFKMGFSIFFFLLGACDGSNTDNLTTQVPISSGSLTAASAKVSASALTSMSFCVTQLKLILADNSSLPSGDGDDLFEARVGLVDLADGSLAVSWGDASLPVGEGIVGVKVEIHHDPETCVGANYSVSYNGSTISQDVELTFDFPQEIIISDATVFNFDLTNIAAAFDAAHTAGQFSDGNITAFIENISDSASD